MVFLVCRSRCPEPVDRIPGGELGEDPETGKKEKKLIFVDCYTSWCGPCKMLAKNVFTQDKVADFYNTEFVCVKMDMEKGEGPALAKKYEVQAFPTLLYIDSKGELKHCVVGMQDADVLIGNGRTALSGEGQFGDIAGSL